MGAGGPHDVAETDQANADDGEAADIAQLAKHGITEDDWLEFSDAYAATWLDVNDMGLGHFADWKARKQGRELERTRIVAKIRRDADRLDAQGQNPDGVFYLLADAIERGEP